MSRIGELLNREEELIPELQPYMREGSFGPMLHHPLLIHLPIDPKFCAYYNEQYRYKKRHVARLIADKKFLSALFMYERPYRLEKLLELKELGLSGDEYWKAVAAVWIDSENIFQHWKTWRGIWASSEPGREVMMDEAEREKLASLPNAFEVYRGVHYEAAQKGLSWTLDKGRAEWFARRWVNTKRGARPTLVTGRVKKKDVYAVFLGRNEEEIVALNVKITGTEIISLK